MYGKCDGEINSIVKCVSKKDCISLMFYSVYTMKFGANSCLLTNYLIRCEGYKT